MLRIALTGGMGSGKSSVADLFAQQGAHIIDADCITHTLTEPDTPAYKAIIAHFGPSVLCPEGTLDRKRLRSLMVDNATERLWLEQLLHPVIWDALHRQLHTPLKNKPPYLIAVIPLLVECLAKYKRYVNDIDRICVVDTTRSRQIERCRAREPTISDHTLNTLLAIQAKRHRRLAIADDIIDNNGTRLFLKKTSESTASIL